LTPHGVVDAGEIELVVDVEADVQTGEVVDTGLWRHGGEVREGDRLRGEREEVWEVAGDEVPVMAEA
jgi:hypothetical protein